jgi:hypothetical protein
MKKIAEKLDSMQRDGKLRTFNAYLCDVARYSSDRYEIDINLRETFDGYSTGCLILHSHIGVASYTRYWHYNKNEYETASKVFDTISKIATEIRDEIQKNKIPPSNLGGMFRDGLKDVDNIHKETSGIPWVNNAHSLDYESDFRESIYGSRYPTPDDNNLSLIYKHPQEETKQINDSKSGRNKTYYYGAKNEKNNGPK